MFNILAGEENLYQNSEIYEIDYKGPETHSYIPPPEKSGGRPFVHRQGANARARSRGQTIVGGNVSPKCLLFCSRLDLTMTSQQIIQ